MSHSNTNQFAGFLFLLFAFSSPLFAQIKEPTISPQQRQHWAFQKPSRANLPQVKNTRWVRNPIDAFILAQLEAKQLTPAPEADKITLLRRITFDLTGLLPTLEEQVAFMKDDSPKAYEHLVERLLASPHYGERWGQHWLDVVRYAESNGYELDGERPYAWRYRDYVIQSFNQDKPFDRFLSEQIAGDERAKGKELREAAELYIATGMHRCGPIHLVSGNTDPEVNRQEVLLEMVQGVGSAFLGLTIHCARCHDHKFDPISQADYYRLEAFFAAAQLKDIDYSLSDERTEYQKKVLESMKQLTPIKKQIDAIDDPYRRLIREQKLAQLDPESRTAVLTDPKKRTSIQKVLVKDAEVLLKTSWDEILDAMSPEDRVRRQKLRDQQHALEAEAPMAPSIAWAITNQAKVPPTYVLKRGDVKRKGGVVQSAFPRVLTDAPEEKLLTRLDLAEWLTSPNHPLTARVFVNRLWQHHFGAGIVATANDFGLRGAKPTHPELLDWLAIQFVESGWKIKDMHRLMVLSSTYRQASQVPSSTKGNEVDPDYKLLWRMNRRRLEGEAIRDNMLLATGSLQRQIGGEMIRIPIEPEVYDLIFTEGEPDGLWHVTPDARQHNRRSLYLFAKRNVRLPIMEAFDQPDRLSPCSGRSVSTFAPQALILMNGPFSQEQSKLMAKVLLQTCGEDFHQVIELAYRRILARPPQEQERKVSLAFLTSQTEVIRDRLLSRQPIAIPDGLPASIDPAMAAAVVDYCLALFNTNEFVYVP